jgi:hypothetical protein
MILRAHLDHCLWPAVVPVHMGLVYQLRWRAASNLAGSRIPDTLCLPIPGLLVGLVTADDQAMDRKDLSKPIDASFSRDRVRPGVIELMPLRPRQPFPAQVLGILLFQVRHDIVLHPHPRLSTARPHLRCVGVCAC